ESALVSHPQVGEAVVVLREDGPQGPRLVGYWSRKGESSPPEGELREWVRRLLPEPLVPSSVVEVSEWPRTPNGKLDERALPSPRVAGRAACIGELRPGSAAAAPPLVAGDRPQPVPLSYAQQRLWFLDQLHPGSAFYNINTAVRLAGELSADALAWALQALVERHEALRTRFPTQGGQPVQEVGPASGEGFPAIEPVDLAGSAEDRELEARRRLATAAQQ